MEGVLLFTIDVDCSTSFLPLKGEDTVYFRKYRKCDRRCKTTWEEVDNMDTR